MTVVATNSTGWAQLMDANPWGAAYTMFSDSAALGGWFIGGLFLLFQIMIYLKTRNFVLMMVTGGLFMAFFYLTDYVSDIARKIVLIEMIVIIALAILQLFFKKND